MGTELLAICVNEKLGTSLVIPAVKKAKAPHLPQHKVGNLVPPNPQTTATFEMSLSKFLRPIRRIS